MTDIFTATKRRQIMTRIRSTNTTPEQRTKRVLRQLGISFRSYDAHLPGRPDIVLRNSRLALFVHGCFWHQHKGCSRNFTPKSNKHYWVPKLARNIDRFAEVKRALRKLDWKVKVVWECQTKNRNELLKLLAGYLNAL